MALIHVRRSELYEPNQRCVLETEQGMWQPALGEETLSWGSEAIRRCLHWLTADTTAEGPTSPAALCKEFEPRLPQTEHPELI